VTSVGRLERRAPVHSRVADEARDRHLVPRLDRELQLECVDAALDAADERLVREESVMEPVAADGLDAERW
jgi:hypothetical protein